MNIRLIKSEIKSNLYNIIQRFKVNQSEAMIKEFKELGHLFEFIAF